ncbi:MAG: hypothetical protein ABEI98_00620 [Halorhabdus sp.]
MVARSLSPKPSSNTARTREKAGAATAGTITGTLPATRLANLAGVTVIVAVVNVGVRWLTIDTEAPLLVFGFLAMTDPLCRLPAVHGASGTPFRRPHLVRIGVCGSQSRNRHSREVRHLD